LARPALTTRGLKERDLEQVAEYIDRALLNKDDAAALKKLRDEVASFAAKFPMPH
jgi:glycine hydroxymethyltransferase